MTDLSLWQTASLPNTVDHVLERYHATHRRQLADAAQLAAKVAARHETFPSGLVDLIQAIEAELSSHMMKEERMLFPMIKNGMGRNAGMPIRVMMMEHEEHEAALAQLLETTNHFTAPADACSSSGTGAIHATTGFVPSKVPSTGSSSTSPLRRSFSV